MKKCPQCDKRYDDLQKFCSDCGVELIDLSWEEQNQLIAEEQKAKTANNTDVKHESYSPYIASTLKEPLSPSIRKPARLR